MTSTPRHRLDVQGLRAVAVVLVMLYHSDLPVPGGFTGVDVFFVISGFVITGLLTRELHATGRIRLTTFYGRRVQRILPALALLLGVVMIGSVALQSPLGPQQDTAGAASAAASFWANFYLYQHTGGYFDAPAEAHPLLHTWSLSVEEQFYFLFPSLLLLCRGRGREITGLGVLLVASFVLGVTSTGSWPFYASPARAWQFAVGALLVYLPVTAPKRALATGLAVAAVALLVGSALGIRQDASFPGVIAWVPVLGAAFAILAGNVGPNPVSWALSTRPMVWLGDLSYSLYLWHWPLVVFAKLLFPKVEWAPVAAVGLSIVPAWLSFRLLETRLRHARMPGRHVLALGLACVIGPVVLARGLEIGANAAWGDTVTLAAHAVRTAPKGIGCEWDPKRGGPPEVCVQEHPGAGGTLLLVGDSHATAVATALAPLAGELGLHAAATSAVGCPFARIPLVDADGPRAHCDVFIDATLTWIREHRPALVVIANRSPVNVNPTVWLHDETQRKGLPKCAGTTYGIAGADCLPPEAALPLWDRGLREVTAEITGLGIPVLLLGTVPEHEHDVMDCVQPRRVDEACARTPRAWVEARRAGVLALERALGDQDPRIEFVDPIDLFCDAATCVQWQDGVFLYRDDDHLSPDGAARLRAPLTDAIRAAMPTLQVSTPRR